MTSPYAVIRDIADDHGHFLRFSLRQPIASECYTY